MSEKVTLKSMRCPTCGGSLKAENNTDSIECVYCGNIIVPVNETPETKHRNYSGEFAGTLKIEGIKTSSSALAYIELFFEEYDWESFSYAHTLSITEIDKLANSLKVTSADDKNTWLVCFYAICVPFLKKVGGCKQLITSVINEYKNNNLESYSKFDAYKRISSMILDSKDKIVANLEKIIANARKYGASDTEIADLKFETERVKSESVIATYKEIDDIPEVRSFISEKNLKITTKLAQKGVDAEKEYAKAKNLIIEKKYVEALGILYSLDGYGDSVDLINKIDRYYLISDVLELQENLYLFKKTESENSILNLHSAFNGKISENAIIRGIKKIITNYADILYYLDNNLHLKRFNLSLNAEEIIVDENLKKFKEVLQTKHIFIHNRKAFLVSGESNEYIESKKDVIELDLMTGTVKRILKDIKEVISFTENKIIYTISKKKTAATVSAESNVLTNIINVDTMDIMELGSKKVTVEGFYENGVVYTQISPNDFNKDLYIKSFDSANSEKLIEQNIYRFCDIVAGKLFYYIGNSRNQSLININCDGSERTEWPLYISKLLFKQGDWVYFIRKAGYNSVLCKSHMDGSKFSIIAANIEKFIEIKNGYLYYINDVSTLVKIRMDGSNLQELCYDVQEVLAVKEDKIIFVSVDDRIKTNELVQTTKIVKSIYAVDFAASGKIKLAYDIKNAKKYDDDTVYYISAEKVEYSHTQYEEKKEILYSLDVETNSSKKLLELQSENDENGSLSKFAIAMIITVIALFVGFFGFGIGSSGVGVLGIIVGFIAFFIGLSVKTNNNGKNGG